MSAGGITLAAVGSPGVPVRVLSMRLLVPWTGVWLADLELDPDQGIPAPTAGKVVITIGVPTPLVTLTGTIDPRGSGTFVEFAHLRVLGGGAGWDKTVTRQDYQADNGVPNTRVYSETALRVGETVNVLVPGSLGVQFVRSMGPASRVLEGQEWWLDFSGITQVGPRPPAVPDISQELIAWDPTTEVADLVCNLPVMPGTVITDARLPGPVTVRDVEQRFDANGSQVTAWCGQSATSQLMGDLRSMVVEFSGRKYLATYLYRIVLQNVDGRLQLQAVDPTLGIPDTLPIQPWTGVSGASVKYKLGTLVRVAFISGDPSQPIADSYAPGSVPLESTVDAARVHIGPTATLVDLGGGTTPLVLVTWATGLLGALTALATALAAYGPLAGAGAALQTALAALPSPGTVKVVAA